MYITLIIHPFLFELFTLTAWGEQQNSLIVHSAKLVARIIRRRIWKEYWGYTCKW